MLESVFCLGSCSPTSGLCARGPLPQVINCEAVVTWGWSCCDLGMGRSARCWEVLWGRMEPGCLLGVGSPGKSAGARAPAFQLELLPDETSKVLEAEASPGGWRQRRLQPAWHALIPTAEGPIPLTTVLLPPVPSLWAAAPPPWLARPVLKPIKLVCEQFIGQSRLCLCQTLMNAHYFFFFAFFLGGALYPLQKPHGRLMP